VEQKKIYFASDLHLGFPDYKQSRQRERLFVDWLQKIKPTAKALYLLGDVFDFWFEYKRAVPRGFTRFLGALSSFHDAGIEVHLFTGNHDMWIFDYLPEETGIILHRGPYETELMGKRFYMAHGDGLGHGDKGYKILKAIFASRVSQWLFARIHPNLGIKIANTWSVSSRNSHEEPSFQGEDKEWLILYSKKLEEVRHADYYVYGHRHVPMDIALNAHSRVVNLGDWVDHFTFAEFDGNHMKLKTYQS
jgi:UDP-2,3-diacylglucosamine hydrolase